jgi:hypothetical protein
MANLVVIRWGQWHLLPAACDDDGTQLTADLSQVMPDGVRLVYRLKGGGPRLKQLQQELRGLHVGSGWFGCTLPCMRKVLLAVRHRQRSTGEHPYFNHGSAGTILNSLRVAVGTTWHRGYYPDSTEAAEWYYMQALRMAAGPDCASSSHKRKEIAEHEPEEEKEEKDCQTGPGREAECGCLLVAAPAPDPAAPPAVQQPDAHDDGPERLGREKPKTETPSVALKLPGVGCNPGAVRISCSPLANGRGKGCNTDSESDLCHSPPHKRARRAELEVEPRALETAVAAESEAVQPQPGTDGSKEAHIAEHSGQVPDWQVLPDVGGNAECACGNLRTNGRCEDCDADLESSPYDSPPHRRYKRARRAELQIGTYAASPALEEACFAALPPTAP